MPLSDYLVVAFPVLTIKTIRTRFRYLKPGGMLMG